MKIIHLLPELEQGGVENHVIALANAQAAAGASVVVVSAGGRLTASLAHDVEHITLPVDKKNIFTFIYCARRVASIARARDVRIIHAHSRVPAWVAYLSKKFFSSLVFVCTVHAMYSKNLGTWPIGRADGVICVSDAVRRGIAYRLAGSRRARVIYNAPTKEIEPWRGSGDDRKRLMIVGRIAPKKNLAMLFDALASIKDLDWSIDIFGDGPKRDELEERAEALGLSKRALFRGYAADIGYQLARHDLFLFPSREEGQPLALIEALMSGIPTLASSIAANSELASGELLDPSDSSAWSDAIRRYLVDGARPDTKIKIDIPTPSEHAKAVLGFYEELI